MKLIMLLCIEEYASDLRKILFDHNVSIFSETNIDGFRMEKGDLAENWFSSSGRRGIYSHLFFSFIDPSTARELMAAVEEYNSELEGTHPLHAFLMDVEDHI